MLLSRLHSAGVVTVLSDQGAQPNKHDMSGASCVVLLLKGLKKACLVHLMYMLVFL